MTDASVEVLTPDQIAQQYLVSMDSVKVLSAGKPAELKDSEWAEFVSRNKEHLRLMLTKTYWTTEDLEPFRKALE